MHRIITLLLVPAVAFAAPVPKVNDKQKIEKLYGKIVDPKGDSKFALDGEKLLVTLPANETRSIDTEPDPKHPNDLKKFARKNNCPRVEFDADGDFELTVRIDARIDPKAAGANREAEWGYLGAGIYITSPKWWNAFALGQLSGQKERKKVRRGVPAVVDGVRSAFLFDCPLFRDSYGNGLGGTTDDTTGIGRPAYLRLKRSGKECVIAASGDEHTWHTLSEELPFQEGPLRLALFAQHSSDKPHTVTFDQFKLEQAK